MSNAIIVAGCDCCGVATSSGTCGGTSWTLPDTLYVTIDGFPEITCNCTGTASANTLNVVPLGTILGCPFFSNAYQTSGQCGCSAGCDSQWEVNISRSGDAWLLSVSVFCDCVGCADPSNYAGAYISEFALLSNDPDQLYDLTWSHYAGETFSFSFD